jgi:hypothetical protein
MLKKAYIFSFITCFLFTLYILKTLLILHPSDKINYRQILQKKDATLPSSLTRLPSYNDGTGIKKEFWIVNDNYERSYSLLESATSKIALLQNLGKIELIENLEDIKCYIKEEDRQYYRYFTSDSGSYLLPSHTFSIDNVSFGYFSNDTFCYPTNCDFKKAYFYGTTKTATLSLIKEKPQIEIKNINATHPERP